VQVNANAAWDAKRQITNTFRINADQSIGASVQKLLEDPITNIRTLVTDLVPAELNGKGKTLCAQFRPLWNKYPFNAGATAQATVAEINAMFRKPDGALWKLYDENLQKLLPMQGGRYVPAPNPAVKLNPAFVRFFQEAAALSEALYADGTQDPHFSFTLKPVPTEGIQNIGLRLDGQALSYTGGTAAPKQFTWQAAGAHEARATVRFGSSTDLAWSNNEGLWAIFQFFGKAERWQPVGNAHQLEWIIRIGKDPMTLPNGSPLTVRFELDMAGAPPVFQKGYFARMGCVAEIAR
jgi:type VI secretion system protein ImpL